MDQEHDLGGGLLTPGLVDCHTHLFYGGRRANEAEMRLNGASYEQIARAGGGIRSTVAATRAASEDALLAGAMRRAQTRQVFEVARSLGLPVKLHAEQLSDQGGQRSPPLSARSRATTWNT